MLAEQLTISAAHDRLPQDVKECGRPRVQGGCERVGEVRKATRGFAVALKAADCDRAERGYNGEPTSVRSTIG